MRTGVLRLVHVLLLAAIVAGGDVSSCKPKVLPKDRGTLEFPPPESQISLYDRNVDCTWKFQPSTSLFGPLTCNRMVATVEFLDTEKDGDILEIIDSSTNRVLASLSGQSRNFIYFPKQYVACSSELTIRFRSNDNGERGGGFKISYTTDRNMLNLKSLSSQYVTADWTICGSESHPACLDFVTLGYSSFSAEVSNTDGDSKSVRISYEEGPSKTLTADRLITFQLSETYHGFEAELCGSTTCKISPVLNGYEYQSTMFCSKEATTHCFEGYQNYGNFTKRVCKQDGKWDHSNPPHCEKIRCSNFPSIDNGHLIFSEEPKSEYYEGEKIEWICDEGFSHLDDLYRRAADHRFPFRYIYYESFVSGVEPSPLLWRLEELGMDKFLKLIASVAGNITCGANGWRRVPKCLPIECPKIILRNGTVSTREQIKLAYKDRAYLYIDRRPQYLSTASFSCSSGFTLVGHSVATCMANSKWNVPLPKCLPETDDVVKDQIATFDNKFLLPLATYSRNAQPDENLLGRHDRSDVLDAQSDVKLDLVLAFSIREESLLEGVYKIFVHNMIMNFPIDAEKTRVAGFVLMNGTIRKFVSHHADFIEENPHNISESFEEFMENINLMFETGLGEKPRDTKRVAIIVSEKFLEVANQQRALAAQQRYKLLNVKSLHISMRDLPHFVDPTADFIEFNTTNDFYAFLNYSNPTTVDDLCGVAGASGQHYPFSNFSVAARGAWPWLVTVLGDGEYECDGVLVHRRWVVTGADCFKKATRTSGWLKGKINNYKIGVEVGQYELNDDDDGLTISKYDGIDVLTRGDHPPPGLKVWRSTRRFKPDILENNMAVIRLDKPIEVSRFRKPICSPRHSEYNAMMSDEMIAIGQTAFLAGYQYVKNGERVVSNVPIESSAVIANLSECRQRWPGKTIIDSNLCVRGIPGNICYGATGTPLMCQDPKTNRYVLCGVGSFGFEDCKDGYAVYTNMRKYEEMIRDTVRMESDGYTKSQY
ncbi:uncharacterized protein [Oscarella lobularis]|uniref:uncharacterized protein isoform X2 n=1 Tax=Oscarella lobularis TaxID=121494 RepID=UPI003313B3A8